MGGYLLDFILHVPRMDGFSRDGLYSGLEFVELSLFRFRNLGFEVLFDKTVIINLFGDVFDDFVVLALKLFLSIFISENVVLLLEQWFYTTKGFSAIILYLGLLLNQLSLMLHMLFLLFCELFLVISDVFRVYWLGQAADRFQLFLLFL